ncbi:MAG: hypothetical protein PHX30_02485 [Candidatus Pacebacteria bacterium]|nr:hypothetical protein [Candidatus Paceibacterota bacterium]
MQISIINDCFDENAQLRQISRAGSLFPNAGVNCFAVKSELEAAGFLIDALDAFDGREGVVLVNVAPRNGEAKKWKNGTPFGYFRHGETLVVSSVDGLVLSLCNKLDLISEFFVLDIEEVMNFISDTELDGENKRRIINTQFRSFNFLPRAADWVWRKYDLPKEKLGLSEIKDVPEGVWFIDNFGNVKTTFLGENFDFKNGEEVQVSIRGEKRSFVFSERLKDLPDKEIGVVEGSSGFGNKRFLEIIRQGGDAAQELGLQVGDSIEF